MSAGLSKQANLHILVPDVTFHFSCRQSPLCASQQAESQLFDVGRILNRTSQAARCCIGWARWTWALSGWNGVRSSGKGDIQSNEEQHQSSKRETCDWWVVLIDYSADQVLMIITYALSTSSGGIRWWFRKNSSKDAHTPIERSRTRANIFWILCGIARQLCIRAFVCLWLVFYLYRQDSKL